MKLTLKHNRRYLYLMTWAAIIVSLASPFWFALSPCLIYGFAIALLEARDRDFSFFAFVVHGALIGQILLIMKPSPWMDIEEIAAIEASTLLWAIIFSSLGLIVGGIVDIFCQKLQEKRERSAALDWEYSLAFVHGDMPMPAGETE